MHRQPAGALQFPVPRTFDLTHVEPQHFAAALGNDPTRIFNWVRDEIAYEVYTGCLRGPRGTLLAMAGNSVDRAALLAAMLKAAGQRVQFARGTLSETDARELVTSMWADRPSTAPPPPAGEPSPALKAAGDTLVGSVKRDFTTIREQLKKVANEIKPDPGPTLDQLVTETRPHYWVQWNKDGAWVDLDPSFADATAGHAYARADETPANLPESLFHRVEIRVKLEEYTGDQPATREILKYNAKAADLSGADLVLSHQPENWKRPAPSLEASITSAIQDTGRVKPVIIAGAQSIIGEPFRQRPPTGRGIGSIGDILSGAGTRHAVPIATAESLEVDLIAPGGKETVAREIFDVVGKGRRAAQHNLSASEVIDRAANSTPDLTEGIYDLYLTTGRVDKTHVERLAPGAPPKSGAPVNMRRGLRRLNIGFVVASDVLLERFGQPNRTVVRFYPDSPRVQIAELSVLGGTSRLSMDLRRDHARAVSIGRQSEDVFDGRVLRGVVDGTLERIIIDYITAPTRDVKSQGAVMSTSLIFERMQAEGIRSVLLDRQDAALAPGIAADIEARLRAELKEGYLLVAPQSPVKLFDVPRLAWWRIVRHSGETIAVTDEGLHQAGTEYQSGHKIVEEQVEGEAEIYRVYTGLRSRPPGGEWSGWRVMTEESFAMNSQASYDAFLERVTFLLRDGSIPIR